MLSEWIAVAGGLAAVLLLGVHFVFSGRSIAGWALLAGALTFGAESLLFGMAVHASTTESMIAWQSWSQAVMALAPGSMLLFSLTYARGNPREFLSKWLFPLTIAFVIPLSCAPFALIDGIGTLEQTGTPFEWYFRVRWPARIIHAMCLLGAVGSLINLEWTFRSSVGTLRWRLKYAVVGCAILLGTRIYTSSQTLLYSQVSIGFLVLNSLALIIASLFVGVALVRSRLDTLDLYPSASAIYRSISAVLVGVYLLLVGLLAEWVSWRGGDTTFPLAALVLFLAIAGLGIMALSDRLRQRLRLLISRHFARPFHDYRQVWATFTERTASIVRQEEYCQAVVRLVAGTFDVLSVSIWLDQERTGRLERGASTTTSTFAFQPGDEAILAEMRRIHREHPLPVNVDAAKEGWCELLRRLNPSRFAHGGFRFAMPLVSADEFVGVLVIGDRVSGLPFMPDDADLLKCIGDQVAANLRNLRLSARVAELREFEAFQLFSTFLVHDLKNTASTLSLMLRNMQAHFNNPAFREDAMRGLGKSVERINDLIQRLTYLRQQPGSTRVAGDMNEVLAAAARKLEGQPDVEVLCKLEPLPRVVFDPQQLESVFTNLILNAREAVGQGGRIIISSRRENGWVVASVEDNGCGMTAEFVSRSLFRPFQTTKKKGLGIGMFQSRMIVESHSGRIEVQTAPDQGTTFRVYLPLVAQENTTPYETALAYRG